MAGNEVPIRVFRRRVLLIAAGVAVLSGVVSGTIVGFALRRPAPEQNLALPPLADHSPMKAETDPPDSS